MAIKRYSKAKPSRYTDSPKEFIELDQSYSRIKQQKPVTIWNSVGEGYGILQTLVNNYRLANLLIPTFFIILGTFFIGKHFWPDLQTWAQDYVGVTNQGTSSPVSDQFIDYSQYISNPAGLGEVAQEAFEQNVLQEDSVSNNYSGTFYISIPALGMEKIPVSANVDSTTESVYNSVLTNSLAHFENTGLPISDVKNNIVIYGHSATTNYNPQRTDPEVAFSFLPELRVGDEIIIEMEGKEYKFKMYRSKIVEPTDLSIITGTKNQQTLTLFTCYPAGNNAQRYVAVARPVVE